MTYKIESIAAKGDFCVRNSDGEELLKLEYDNWFTSKGNSLINSQLYSIASKNIWQTEFVLTKNKEKIGSVSFNFKLNAIFNLEGDFYVLKYKGIFNGKFELMDGKDNVLMTLKPMFKWSKLRYEYLVETTDFLNNNSKPLELLLITPYIANVINSHYIAAAS